MYKGVFIGAFLSVYIAIGFSKKFSGHELFLKGLDESLVKRYHEIRSNDTLTKREYKSELQAFISSLPSKNQGMYKRIEEASEKKHNRQKTNLEKKFHNLNEDVKKVATQIQAIRDDLDITRRQEKEKIHQLKAGLPKEVRKELKKLFPSEQHRPRGKVTKKQYKHSK